MKVTWLLLQIHIIHANDLIDKILTSMLNIDISWCLVEGISLEN